ncbi:MAG: PIG-L family deacetylase [Armatimonadetes bacterium]|nr:PIG-L family deacetylase [Armatimonadota bacterium]
MLTWLRQKRWLSFALALGLLAVGASLGRIALDIRRQNLSARKLDLPEIPRLSRNDRVMIFAPHCDDETLGCGGLLQKALAAGCDTRVVLVTNGDGFPFAAKRAFKELRVPARDYIRLAYERQKETQAALRTLGLPADHILFLGYPDSGLAALWNDYFPDNRFYASRFTRHSRSPYRNIFHPHAPYCGSSVLKDIQEVIRRFRPTLVCLPHPNDNHGDHWATHAFVVSALEETGWRKSVRLYAYLVHRGDWPVPQGLRPAEPLAPPARLARLNTRWFVLPLTGGETALKQRAVACYQSQMAVIGRFLKSFIRANELFGTIADAIAPEVAPGSIRFGGPATQWNSIKPALLDPIGDTVGTELEGHADFSAVRVAHSPGALHLRVTLRKRFSREVRYTLRLHALTPEHRILNLRLDRPASLSDQGILFAAQGNSAEIALPNRLLGKPKAVMLALDARVLGVLVDKTAWQVVRMEPDQGPPPGLPTGGTSSLR